MGLTSEDPLRSSPTYPVYRLSYAVHHLADPNVREVNVVALVDQDIGLLQLVSPE